MSLSKHISPKYLSSTIWKILFLGAIVVIVILVFLSIVPASLTTDVEEEGAEIYFSADRRLIAFPGGCVTVSWEVQYIQAVYLNGNGVIGNGEEQLCLDNEFIPTLEVIFRDETSHIYQLNVRIMSSDPLIQSLVGLSFFCLLLSSYKIWQDRYATLLQLVKHVIKNSNFTIVIKKLALIGGGIVFAVILLEIGLRFYFSEFGTEDERVKYLYSMEEILSREMLFIGQPYVNYSLSPGYPTHNNLGYRGPEIELPKPEGTYRIVTLGGSTTYGFKLDHWESAYPAQLERILHEDYGYSHVEIINAGVGGYSSWENLITFAFRVLDLDPDMIIYYGATNDVSYRLVDPDFYNGLNPARGIWQTHYNPLPVSALYRFVGITLGWVPEPGNLMWQIRPLDTIVRCQRSHCNELGMSPEEVLASNPPIYFERNLSNIVAIARANNIQVMFSTWTYFPEQPGYWNSGNYMIYEFRQDAIDEHNTIIRDLAMELSIPLYDLHAHMPYNAEFWIDGRHMTELGTYEQAKQYAAFLVEQNLLPVSE